MQAEAEIQRHDEFESCPPVAPNLLEQTFEPTRSNEVWVNDITSVATGEGWLYLAGIKDVFTCEIVGYAFGARMKQELPT